jgi:hypothetical protein
MSQGLAMGIVARTIMAIQVENGRIEITKEETPIAKERNAVVSVKGERDSPMIPTSIAPFINVSDTTSLTMRKPKRRKKGTIHGNEKENAPRSKLSAQSPK